MSTNGDLRVVVVDDDFMIGRIHQQYTDSLPGFMVVGIAVTAAETLSLVEKHHPDLLLLDIYLPDRSGIELMGTLRSGNCACDIIAITAAKELKVVEQGFRLGVFDYLIKPFSLEQLGVSLRKYLQYKSKFEVSKEASQGVVDYLKKIRATELTEQDSKSGIDARTLERVRQALTDLNHAHPAEDIAKAAGVSRSTARTYLDFMVQRGMAQEQLSYGTVGRPKRLFRKEQ